MWKENNGFSPWLLAAVSAPLAQTASGHSWLTVLITGGVCLGSSILLEKVRVVEGARSRWCCVAQWLWLAVVLSQLAHLPMACWPKHQSYIAVPLTLLGLAGWSASKGIQEAARAGNVLMWLLLLIFGAVNLSAVKDIQLDNLTPQLTMPNGMLIVTFLIPCLMAFLGEKKRNVIHQAVAGCIALSSSLLATGILSLPVVERTASPYYEMSRSLSLLGIAERFESLVAAAMTLGYFALFSLLISVGGELSEQIKPAWRSKGVWGAVIIAGTIFVSGMRVEGTVLAVGCIIGWVMLPLCEACFSEMIGRKKTQKST